MQSFAAWHQSSSSSCNLSRVRHKVHHFWCCSATAIDACMRCWPARDSTNPGILWPDFRVKLRNFHPAERVEEILPADPGTQPVRHFALFIVAVSMALGAVSASRAQIKHYTDGVVGQFDDTAGEMLLEPATITAKFTPPTAERPATLLITAKIARGRHT